ncbi:MAG: LCP family protein [Candidatus Woesebacteria bacterium]|nr:MAG: LCP family protein [Candidatus Woesebacteria bacterium]
MQKLTKNKILFLKIKRKALKHLWLARFFLLAIIFVIISTPVIFFVSWFNNSLIKNFTNLAEDFLFAPQYKLSNTDGRVNILVLGKGGIGHDAPDLTDTMILVSVSLKSPKIVSISIPRDIWVSALRAKINSAYYWGNQKENQGLTLAKATVENIVSVPIHYAVVIDFGGFTKVIDTIGGVDVNIKYSFTDNQFPIAGKEDDTCNGDLTYKCRYETIHFDQGITHMDGETALKFVRSRHAVGDQGTDFARDERQQEVILAIKTKILSKEVLFSPQKVIDLLNLSKNYIQTDIKTESIAVLARYVLNGKTNIKTFVFPQEFLINPPISSTYDNQYVFIPNGGNWSKVQEWIKSILP